MSSKTPLFKIRNLRFLYPQKKGSNTTEWTLQLDSLDLHKGEITLLRGHNGSGKSTLLKLLAGLLNPDKGSIESSCKGKPVMVMQEPYLFGGSVQQNLLAALRFSGLEEKEPLQRVSRMLDKVGLKGFEKRRARELSGGEKKRIAIARALMSDPEVLMLDEPDANVDNQTSRELEQLIRSLKEEGMTLILCSHHRGFAYRTADRMVDLYRGKWVDHHENIFQGTYTFREGLYSLFNTGFYSFAAPSRKGEFRTLVIPSDQIVLSRKPVKEGKGENQWSGILQSINPSKEGQFTLTLECENNVHLRVRLSESELTMHQFIKGEKLTLFFSASSVKLY